MKITRNCEMLIAGFLFSGPALVNAGAQSHGGVPLWTNLYAAPSGRADATGIAVDNSGNVFVTGASVGSMTTVAYSGAGQPLWTNSYSQGLGASATATAIDSRGNVFVTGWSWGINDDYATIAYSGAGTPLWTNSYNGPANLYDVAIAIVVDRSDNVLITGYSDKSNFYGAPSQKESYTTIKYSNMGVPLWTNRYHWQSNSIDEAAAIAVDQNGNVFVTGTSARTYQSSYDCGTVAYSAAGTPLWTNRFQGSAFSYQTGAAIVADQKGKVFVTGGSGSGYLTVAYSAAGAALWTNLYGSGYGKPTGIAVDNTGKVLVTGSSPKGRFFNHATLAYTGAGAPLWTNFYAGRVADYTLTYIAADRRGNVFVTGASSNGIASDCYTTVAYSASGVALWTNRYGVPNLIPYYISDVPAGIAVDNRGNVFVTGTSEGHYVTIKYSAVNTPPVVLCPTNSIVECGTSAALTASVSDNDGDKLSAAWLLNGVLVQTNTVVEGASLSGTNLSFTAVLPRGTNSIEINVADSAGYSASCSTTVVVVDTTPPVIHAIMAEPEILWPPDRTMVPVHLDALVTDACGPAEWKIASVGSDEATDSQGATTPDWEILGDHDVTLRAERFGQGSGRVYSITIQAADISGNVSESAVTVLVPHDLKSTRR